MYDSIYAALIQHAKKMPDKVCVVDEQEVVTYTKFLNRIHRIANFLLRNKINKQDRVMISCSQDAWFLSCAFACSCIGAIFVPVEEGASEIRTKEIIVDTNAKLFFHPSITYEGVLCMPISEIGALDHNSPDVLYDVEKKNIAEILYTTGTTGVSKGIEISNESNLALAENIIYGTKMNSDNVECIPLPLSHSHGLRTAYANMLNGSTIVLIKGIVNINKVFQFIDNYHVTALDLSPSAAAVLCKLSKNKLSDYSDRLDYIQIGTAVLPEEVKAQFISQLPKTRLYNFYGSTESGRCAVFEFRENRINCIGKASCHAKIIITDESKNPIKSSKSNSGLLAISGKMNMNGYWKQQKLTEQVMKNKTVYTNDVGYMDEEGYIYLVGRKDYLINYKGINVSPEEIEEIAMKYVGVADCVCVGEKSKLEGEYPKLYIVWKEECLNDKSGLLEYLKTHVDGNKMPKEIEETSCIPRASNGKILRGECIGR